MVYFDSPPYWKNSRLSSLGRSLFRCCRRFSIDLGFYWHLLWPQSIASKSLKIFRRKAHFNGEIISINLLKYIVAIINYAICSAIFSSKKLNHVYKYQTLLNWSDNKSAIAWTKQTAISTAGEEALARIFCSLSINNDLQCTSAYINTKDNVVADNLSHNKFASSINTIQTCLQAHAELKSCERFHLNPDFISCLTHAVL